MKVKTFGKKLIGTVSRICETESHSLRKKRLMLMEFLFPNGKSHLIAPQLVNETYSLDYVRIGILKQARPLFLFIYLFQARPLEGFSGSSAGKESTCNVEDLGFDPWEDPLEKGKAAHSSILAWRIPWTIQSMGSQRVRFS